MRYLLHSDKFILACTETNLLAVLKSSAPMGIGVQEVELVLAFECTVVVVAVQDVVRLERGGSNNEVGTGLVERNGVERGKYAYVGHDSGIVVIPTVALGRHIDNKAHVEVRLVLQHTGRIFGNLIVEALGCIVGTRYSGIVLTHSNTLSATYTARIVDNRLAVDERNGLMGAMTHTHTTTHTLMLLDARL